MQAERRRIVFSGHVQGVGFRMTAVQLARGLSLAGTVRNLPQGQVELIAQGPNKEIDELLGRLGEHFAGMIRRVDQEPLSSPEPAPLAPGIRIIH